MQIVPTFASSKSLSEIASQQMRRQSENNKEEADFSLVPPSCPLVLSAFAGLLFCSATCCWQMWPFLLQTERPATLQAVAMT